MSASMPEIIAHRGASRECLENTLPAFDRALLQGADGIELDVHLTRDGKVVVHHDPFVRRRIGKGPPTVALVSLDLEALHTHRLRDGQMIPTLDAVLDLVGSRATVYIEVKATGAEDALVACLERHPASNIAVHSFDHRIPVAVRARRPGTAIGLLSASYPLDIGAMIRPAAAESLWQQARLIDEALVREAHAAGATVIAWTENEPAHARALVRIGVDALCTDTPGAIRAVLSAPPRP